MSKVFEIMVAHKFLDELGVPTRMDDDLKKYSMKDRIELLYNGLTGKNASAVEEPTFEEELTLLLNKHSIDNYSNTPDYILASMIRTQIYIFGNAVATRDKWYNFNQTDSFEVPETKADVEVNNEPDELEKMDLTGNMKGNCPTVSTLNLGDETTTDTTIASLDDENVSYTEFAVHGGVKRNNKEKKDKK